MKAQIEYLASIEQVRMGTEQGNLNTNWKFKMAMLRISSDRSSAIMFLSMSLQSSDFSVSLHFEHILWSYKVKLGTLYLGFFRFS